MKYTVKRIVALLALCAPAALFAAPSGITVSLKMDETNYVVGERVRCVVDVKNMLPETIHVSHTNFPDRLFIELFAATDGYQLERARERPFVAPFYLKSNQGQKFEAFLADHYDLGDTRRYLARPVLVHDGIRYEGLYRSFDMVQGMYVGTAVQMFSNRPGLKRVFELRRWPRQGTQHLFVAVHDEGARNKLWPTLDVGPLSRVTEPAVSIMPSGEVIVFHSNSADTLARTEFWSMPDAFVFRPPQVVINDPETSGQKRVQEMYRKSGGVKAKQHPWWKFWD